MNKPYVPIRKRVEARKTKDNREKKLHFSDFKADMKRNPMIFIGLLGSAFLTALAGLFIGLAPTLDAQGNLHLFGGVLGIGSAVFGIFFALIYAVTFPIIGEYGTYYWHRKAALRDEGNRTQAWIGYGMFAITFSFMVATAVSASVIVASLLHTFSEFTAIPAWAQKWTVLVIPIALALHAGANIWYDHVSRYAEERREMERDLQTTEIEAENMIREARIDAKKTVAISLAEEYVRLSAHEARETGKTLAGETWKRDKADFGGDHDGDGVPNVADRDYVHGPNGREKETVNSPR